VELVRDTDASTADLHGGGNAEPDCDAADGESIGKVDTLAQYHPHGVDDIDVNAPASDGNGRAAERHRDSGLTECDGNAVSVAKSLGVGVCGA
jgi:hypothetical protein